MTNIHEISLGSTSFFTFEFQPETEIFCVKIYFRYQDTVITYISPDDLKQLAEDLLDLHSNRESKCR